MQNIVLQFNIKLTIILISNKKLRLNYCPVCALKQKGRTITGLELPDRGTGEACASLSWFAQLTISIAVATETFGQIFPDIKKPPKCGGCPPRFIRGSNPCNGFLPLRGQDTPEKCDCQGVFKIPLCPPLQRGKSLPGKICWQARLSALFFKS